jgi:hypothetical protein
VGGWREEAVVAHCLSGERWRVEHFGAVRAAGMELRAAPAVIRAMESGFRGIGAWAGVRRAWSGALPARVSAGGRPGVILLPTYRRRTGEGRKTRLEPDRATDSVQIGTPEGLGAVCALAALTIRQYLSTHQGGGSMGGCLRCAGAGLFSGLVGAIALGPAAGSGAPRDESRPVHATVVLLCL